MPTILTLAVDFGMFCVSVLSGMLGVGPGFLLVPALILLGVRPRAAAAINSVADAVASHARAAISTVQSMQMEHFRFSSPPGGAAVPTRREEDHATC